MLKLAVAEKNKESESLLAKVDSESTVVKDLNVQIDLINNALQATRNRLSTKEEEMERIATDFRAHRVGQEATGTDATTCARSTDNSDSSSTKMNEIIEAAKALRRTDADRATSLQQLATERQVTSSSLRKLRKSVKKYLE